MGMGGGMGGFRWFLMSRFTKVFFVPCSTIYLLRPIYPLILLSVIHLIIDVGQSTLLDPHIGPHSSGSHGPLRHHPACLGENVVYSNGCHL